MTEIVGFKNLVATDCWRLSSLEVVQSLSNVGTTLSEVKVDDAQVLLNVRQINVLCHEV